MFKIHPRKFFILATLFRPYNNCYTIARRDTTKIQRSITGGQQWLSLRYSASQIAALLLYLLCHLQKSVKNSYRTNILN